LPRKACRSVTLIRGWADFAKIAWLTGDRSNKCIGVCQVTRYARNLTYGFPLMARYHVGQVFPRSE
jgi:hypothetical protein